MGKSFSEIINEMITMPNIQWPEVWTAIVETLYMTVVSTIFAFILGLILVCYYSCLLKVSLSVQGYFILSFLSLLTYLERYHLLF